MNLKTCISIIILLPLLLTGCSLFEPEPRLIDPTDLPSSFKLYDPDMPVTDKWWTQFGSAELDAFMEKVFSGNLTIKESYARLKQADARLTMTGSSRFPGLQASAGYSRTRQNMQMGTAMDGITSTNTYSLGLSIPSYELDLWGRVKSVRNAAFKDTMASREDLRTAYLSVSAETVSRWLELNIEKETLRLLNIQLKSNQQSLFLMETRFRLGNSTALDVYQQRQSIASLESLIPSVEARITEVQNEISVLAGLTIDNAPEFSEIVIPSVSGIPNPGIPADVLAGRPDVRRAGLALESADWNLRAARADRLPAIRLTGSLSYNSSEVSNLFDNWIGNLASSLAGPVFDAGRRKAEVERTRAVVEERLAGYRKTVLSAIVEVQNSIIDLNAEIKTYEAQERQLKAARDTYRESLDRYRKGSIDYLPVLTSLTQSQQLERAVLQTKYKLLLKKVNLFRSIGGDWIDDLTEVKK